MISYMETDCPRREKRARTLRAWELALLLALCAAFGAGMLADRDHERLASQMIRLHVVANSDSPEDQAEKLLLRDRALALLAPLLRGCADRDEALETILSHREALEALGDATVQVGTEYYPTRRYGSFSLPAGEYLSLRIVMGEGRGQNWWCVVFPPLCTEALADPAQEEDAFLALDEDDRALITQDGPAYELRFRVAELWGRLKELLSGAHGE